MNTYLYAWSNNGSCGITKVIARSYEDCQDKIIEEFMEYYDDLSDTIPFNEFRDILYDKHEFVLGDIYNIEEFE